MEKIDKDWIDSKLQIKANTWFANRFEPDNDDLKITIPCVKHGNVLQIILIGKILKKLLLIQKRKYWQIDY